MLGGTSADFFLPFHSDRSRLRGGYKSTLSPELVLDTIRSNRTFLRRKGSDLVPIDLEERVVMMQANEIRQARHALTIALQKLAHSDLNKEATVLAAANLALQWSRAGVVGERMHLGYDSDTILASLGLNPKMLSACREQRALDVLDTIDRIFNHLEGSKNGTPWKPYSLKIRQRKPLFGLTYLDSVVLLTAKDASDFLRGMVLFDHADYAPTRQRVNQIYPFALDKQTVFKMGGGVTLPLDRAKLRSLRASKRLAITPDQFEYWVDKGVIVYDPRGRDDTVITNTYVPYEQGPGFSDVAGLLVLQRLYGSFATCGGVVMDALDTYKEGFSRPFFGSFPHFVGSYISYKYEQLMGKRLLEDSEVVEFVYLGAKANVKHLPMSLSHRALHQGSFSAVRAILKGKEREVHISQGSSRYNLHRLGNIVDQRLEQLAA